MKQKIPSLSLSLSLSLTHTSTHTLTHSHTLSNQTCFFSWSQPEYQCESNRHKPLLRLPALLLPVTFDADILFLSLSLSLCYTHTHTPTHTHTHTRSYSNTLKVAAFNQTRAGYHISFLEYSGFAAKRPNREGWSPPLRSPFFGQTLRWTISQKMSFKA